MVNVNNNDLHFLFKQALNETHPVTMLILCIIMSPTSTHTDKIKVSRFMCITYHGAFHYPYIQLIDTHALGKIEDKHR